MANEGRVFSDSLMLGAMACEARVALVSVRRGGRWSTLSYGAARGEQVGDPVALEFLSRHPEIVEVCDPLNHPVLSASALVRPPVAARWLVGMALRDDQGEPLGVLCILDPQRKQLTSGQRKAVMAIARQLEGYLGRRRRPSAAVASEPQDTEEGRPLLLDAQPLMRSHEVAALFNVTERTVINWVALGKLPARRTIGGHLRFRGEDVTCLLERRPGAVGADPAGAAARQLGRDKGGKQLLRSHEVARLSNVTERTVINWAASGKLPAFRTLGGHLRFRGEDVASLLDGRSRPVSA